MVGAGCCAFAGAQAAARVPARSDAAASGRGRTVRDLRSVHFEDREERVLRDVDAADALHPLLPLLLFLKELALARDVAAVALREDVLPHWLDGLATQDLSADGRLDDHLEELTGD